MKRFYILFVLCFLAINVSAQEHIVPDFDRNKFKGVVAGAGMEKFLYIPYFNKVDKGNANFTIARLNYQDLSEEEITTIEIPATYSLTASGYSAGYYLLIFYDKDKDEDIYITVSNNNINQKKTVKHKNDNKHILNTNIPEGFVVITIEKKGGYIIEKIGYDLEVSWEKEYAPESGESWSILSIKPFMEDLEIIRKEKKSGNRYLFTQHLIPTTGGEDSRKFTINTNEVKGYPTFYSSNEGMSFVGGYYYKDGAYTDKPDGLFFAVPSPDGELEQLAKVPYSQVLEDLKSTVGSKLLSPNTTILFTDGIMSHETQSLIMSGIVLTIDKKDNGCKVQTGDVVTVQFSIERGYKSANVVEIEDYSFELKGDCSETNILDLGSWMYKSQMLPFQGYLKMPGAPLLSYIKHGDNNILELCIKNAALAVDTGKEMCVIVAEAPIETESRTFNGLNTLPKKSHKHGLISSNEDFNSIIKYEISDLLKFQRISFPDLEKLRVHIPPEMPEEPEPIEEEEIMEEEPNTQEGEQQPE